MPGDYWIDAERWDHPTVVSRKQNSTPISSSDKPIKIDDQFETVKVLIHIEKTLSRLDPLEQGGFCLPVSSRNSATCSLSLAEIGAHLVSLRIEYISRLARPIVHKLLTHVKNVNIFNHAVDYVALALPSYPQIIKKPMDLGTIKSRLQCGHYRSIESCFADIRLVFRNAIHFNGSDHYIGILAAELLAEFDGDVKALEEKMSKEVSSGV
jgi:hypothetical protein